MVYSAYGDSLANAITDRPFPFEAVLRRRMHHGIELFEVDAAIAISIDLANQFINLASTDRFPHVATVEHFCEILTSYLAVTIDIESAESRPTLIPVHVMLSLDGCS